jgi:hypothetical protein
MPRPRRKGPARKLAAVRPLNKSLRRHLLHGAPYFPDREGSYADDAEIAAAWEYHGPELLPDFVDRNPGKRPHAWWVARGLAVPPANQQRGILAHMGELAHGE